MVSVVSMMSMMPVMSVVTVSSVIEALVVEPVISAKSLANYEALSA